MLTKKQNELLTYLIKRIESDGVTPSYEEICSALLLKSKSGIHRIVKSLEERGLTESDLMPLVYEDEDDDWAEKPSIKIVTNDELTAIMSEQDVCLSF